MAPTASTASPEAAKRGAAQSTARSRSPATNTTTPTNTNKSTAVSRARSVKNTTGSPLTAKGTAKRPGQSTNNEAGEDSEDAKGETANLVDDLKTQLRKAEEASDGYQKQIHVLQSRLDDATSDHAKLEESANANVERLEEVQKEKQDAIRRHRELEKAYEDEKVTTMKEREEAANREDELNEIIIRMKENQREKTKSLDSPAIVSRSSSFRGRSSPHLGDESPSSPREGSQNNAKLLFSKDKLIESLRLELAEAQIRLAEAEHAGGGKSQELEKALLEARMSNAKLMEENESYQVLLSERTLNGELAKNAIFDPTVNSALPRTPEARTPSKEVTAGSSLADELENADSPHPDEYTRKLEAELHATKDQNKALTLYINKIITRLLQTESFETLFENGTLPDQSGRSPSEIPERPKIITQTGQQHDKPLPARPSLDDKGTNNLSPTTSRENNAPSLLQRAGSLFGGPKRQRPTSLNPETTSQLTSQQNSLNPHSPAVIPLPPTPTGQQMHLTANSANEDPETSTSIPLRRSASGRGHMRGPSFGRGHRRATSEWAPNVVNNMYRGGGMPTSPTGLGSPRSSSIGPAPPLILEDNEPQKKLNADDASTVSKQDAASDSGYGGSKAPSEIQSVSEQNSNSPRSQAAAALEGRSAAVAALEGRSTVLQRSDTGSSVQSHDRPENNRPTSMFANATSAAAGAAAGASNWFRGSTAAESKMRPLRLVQEKHEADEAALAERKKANRASLMGWFGRGTAPGSTTSPPQTSAGTTGGPPAGQPLQPPLEGRTSHDTASEQGEVK